jgi:hypothetical protein
MRSQSNSTVINFCFLLSSLSSDDSIAYLQENYTLLTKQSASVATITILLKNDQSKLSIDGQGHESGVPYLIQLSNSQATQNRQIKIKVLFWYNRTVLTIVRMI